MVLFAVNQRTRIRNSTLHNQLLATQKILAKNHGIAEHRLNESSRICIETLKNLKYDSKRMTKIGEYWAKTGTYDISSERGTKSNDKRAKSAPVQKQINKHQTTVDKIRPQTAKAAQVIKFAKLDSYDPGIEAFQVHCRKIKVPVLKRTFTTTAHTYIPCNMNQFEDDPNWQDVERVTRWLDSSSTKGRECRLERKTPLIMAEFCDEPSSPICERKPTIMSHSEKESLSTNDSATDSIKQTSSVTEKRNQWRSAINKIVAMSFASEGFSRESAVKLQQMFKIHESQMRSSGFRSALHSTSQLQQAKDLQRVNDMEPLSEREIKQKILSAQNALQKDIDAAKDAERRLANKAFAAFSEKLKTNKAKIPNSKESSQQKKDSLSRNSVASTDDEEEFDLFKATVLPNMRINDEMEKQVSSYLQHVKSKKKSSTTKKKESVAETQHSMENSVNITSNEYDEATDRPSVSKPHVDYEKMRENRRIQNAQRLIDADKRRRAEAESTTITSLMTRLRNAQRKLYQVKQSARDLDASLRRADKFRQKVICI